MVGNKSVKIKAEGLTKKFELLPFKDTANKIKSLVGVNQKNQQDFWALRGVSFEIYDGECVGLIGLNGAGKSTVSNIISGQITQTTGTVEINGEVSIIAANAGMQNNLSGRENIRLKGLMMGMTNRELKAKMADIIAFSELGPFIDQPVKTYSSGMKAKLGFSIMVHQDPDIMIIDEGLSVGDQTFVDKSKKKMFEFRERGKTILLVSHDMRVIRDWCDRVVWLDHGAVKAYGPPDEIIPEYTKFTQWFKKLPRAEQEAYRKKARQAQLDYVPEGLESQEAVESTEVDVKGAAETESVKDNHHLTRESKILLVGCLFAYIWLALVAMGNVTFVQSVAHPVRFLTGQRPLNTEAKKVAKSETAKKSKPEKKASLASSAAKPRAAAPIAPGTYRVVPGDSPDVIAERAHITEAVLLNANALTPTSMIYPGEWLIIPTKQQAEIFAARQKAAATED